MLMIVRVFLKRANATRGMFLSPANSIVSVSIATRGIPSLADTLLEMGAFGLVMLYALQNRDYRLLLKPSRESLLLAIPLVAIDTLTILFAGDKNIPLVAFALLRKTLTIISIGHILLSALLALGVFQGLRWYYKSRPGRGLSVRDGSGSNQGRG